MEARPATAKRPIAAAAPTVVSAVARGTPPSPPASLRGTTEDGALRVDADGNLVVGPEVLRLFDYHLSAIGEESLEAIRPRIVAAIHHRVEGERARGQALALLDTYLDYREATRRLEPEGDDLAERFAALDRLRRRSFGPAVAQKLFGEEQAAVAVALAQRRVLLDPALTPDERRRRLADLEAELPGPVRKAHAAATRPTRERHEEEAMRAAGASDAEVRAHRVAVDGEAAADRLAELDRRRAAWQDRLAAFREARAEITRSQPDPDLAREAAQRLLDTSFTPLEQIRVEAADHMTAK